MAKAKSKKPAKEESDSEPVYEINKIVKHKGQGKKLEYRVKWKGYDSEDDSWEPAEMITDDAPTVVEKYWKTIPEDRKWQQHHDKPPRVKPSSTASGTPVASNKRKSLRGDEDDEGSSSRKKKATPNGGSAAKAKTNGSESRRTSRREASPELKSPKRKGRKVQDEEEEEEEQEEQEEEVEEETAIEEETEDVDMKEEDIYNVGGRENIQHEKDYEDMESWEDVITSIDTIERSVQDGLLQFFVVWETDNSFSWVTSSLVRQKAPQKVIDFYETHLKFTAIPARETSYEDDS
ncbi:hypothetical protein MNV49_002395 [Pseudohyphozyma bogoriensis]|nr:hypothetical protein MNV49_002395 [Pseudohyphozyma bogoriensis]